MAALLEIEGLCVAFPGSGDDHPVVNRPVVNKLTLSVGRGEVVALVGESGSGKSMTALSLMRLLPAGAAITAGSVRLDGEDLLAASPSRLNRIRGNRIGMLFQQPHAMLDPTCPVGAQVAEPLRRHRGLGRRAAAARVVALLREVGIPEPARRASSYAHQLSGGMAQRVMIAAALSADPDLLIADEPTTALDVTVQAQILALLDRERRDRGLAILLITHDLAVVAALADRVAVMYAGRIVEAGPTAAVLADARHPYTQALVQASLLRPGADGTLVAIPGSVGHGAHLHSGCCFLPRCATAAGHGIGQRCAAHEPELATVADSRLARCWTDLAAPAPLAAAPLVGSAPGGVAAPRDPPQRARPPLVEMQGLVKHYRLSAFGSSALSVRSVDGVSLRIAERESLGLVGESGCGKSTLARLLLHLTPPTAGAVTIGGQDFSQLSGASLRQARRGVQLIFQNPAAALDPRMRIGASLDAPLSQHGIDTASGRGARVRRMLGEVGLDDSFLDRRPGQCSGGQLQRVVIARALLLEPRFLVCDEPTSALDASIRAQILNLLVALQQRFHLTVLMISHDLRVVRYMCDRVAVMYLGQIVELAPRDDLFARPAHPYTAALIAASLLEENGLRPAAGVVRGEPPSPLHPPAGCRFHPRCPMAEDRCRTEAPALEAVGHDHEARCHFWRRLPGHQTG